MQLLQWSLKVRPTRPSLRPCRIAILKSLLLHEPGYRGHEPAIPSPIIRWVALAVVEDIYQEDTHHFVMILIPKALMRDGGLAMIPPQLALESFD